MTVCAFKIDRIDVAPVAIYTTVFSPPSFDLIDDVKVDIGYNYKAGPDCFVVLFAAPRT
jgi:hypothetical protein